MFIRLLLEIVNYSHYNTAFAPGQRKKAVEIMENRLRFLTADSILWLPGKQDTRDAERDCH
jgi:hypothetical protein